MEPHLSSWAISADTELNNLISSRRLTRKGRTNQPTTNAFMGCLWRLRDFIDRKLPSALNRLVEFRQGVHTRYNISWEPSFGEQEKALRNSSQNYTLGVWTQIGFYVWPNIAGKGCDWATESFISIRLAKEVRHQDNFQKRPLKKEKQGILSRLPYTPLFISQLLLLYADYPWRVSCQKLHRYSGVIWELMLARLDPDRQASKLHLNLKLL